MSARRRLFFALWPDGATRAAIHRATHQAVRHAGGRSTSAADLHLTLAFLGGQPEAKLAAILAAAAELQPPAGELALSRLGRFERARVLWLGPERTPMDLRAFVRGLWAALAPLGIVREARPFAAHVTLARKVECPPGLQVHPVVWHYTDFVLAESAAEAGPSRYRIVARWPPPSGAGEAVE